MNARRLEKKILTQGWRFVRIADGLQKNGVGDTPQEAFANALVLALRRTNTHFNAAEVKDIEFTEYPWFFLVRIRVFPCRIQQGAELPFPLNQCLLQSPPGRGGCHSKPRFRIRISAAPCPKSSKC
jgi:hypothetical protein